MLDHRSLDTLDHRSLDMLDHRSLDTLDHRGLDTLDHRGYFAGRFNGSVGRGCEAERRGAALNFHLRLSEIYDKIRPLI